MLPWVRVCNDLCIRDLCVSWEKGMEEETDHCGYLSMGMERTSFGRSLYVPEHRDEGQQNPVHPWVPEWKPVMERVTVHVWLQEWKWNQVPVCPWTQE